MTVKITPCKHKERVRFHHRFPLPRQARSHPVMAQPLYRNLQPYRDWACWVIIQTVTAVMIAVEVKVTWQVLLLTQLELWIRNFDYRHFFCHVKAKMWQPVEIGAETWAPSKNQWLTPSHRQFFHMPWPEFKLRQYWQIASNKWQCLGPLNHKSWPPGTSRTCMAVYRLFRENLIKALMQHLTIL